MLKYTFTTKRITGPQSQKGEPRENSHLHNRRDKLNEEARDFQQRRIEMVEVVHYEAFDMTSILILICHDHHFAITKGLYIIILFPMLEPNDLFEGSDFSVLVYLRITSTHGLDHNMSKYATDIDMCPEGSVTG